MTCLGVTYPSTKVSTKEHPFSRGDCVAAGIDEANIDGKMSPNPKDKHRLNITACRRANEECSFRVFVLVAWPWFGQKMPRAVFQLGKREPAVHHFARPMSSTSNRNTPAESSTSVKALSDAELDRLLNREASAIQRELEVDRILSAFKLKYAFRLAFLLVFSCSRS